MKKFLVVIATAFGAAVLQRQFKSKQAENRLWSEATDSPKD